MPLILDNPQICPASGVQLGHKGGEQGTPWHYTDVRLQGRQALGGLDVIFSFLKNTLGPLNPAQKSALTKGSPASPSRLPLVSLCFGAICSYTR